MDLLGEVACLRQKLEEEQAARLAAERCLWGAMDELREEVRQRAPPVDPLQSAGGDVAMTPLVADARVKYEFGAVASCDVMTQTEEEPAQRGANINDLDHGLLKRVLGNLDCRQMFRAKRVCRRWRSTVDTIVGDCRQECADRQTAAGGAPAPATVLQLVTMAREEPRMTKLQAPTAERQTDLGLVATSCNTLETADLRGFKLRASALRRLACANASTLRDVTLPAGVSEWHLETLLTPLLALERLSLTVPPDSTGWWLRALPKTLNRLFIAGHGPTQPTVECFGPPSVDGLCVAVYRAGDQLLDQLTALLTAPTNGYHRNRITHLYIQGHAARPMLALRRLLTALTNLKGLTLWVVGVHTMTMLDALHVCSQLETLKLKEALRRPVAVVPEFTRTELASISRLAVALRKLKLLYLFTSENNTQLVTNTLTKTDLGCEDGTSQPRAVKVYRMSDPAAATSRGIV
ncbi:uncharacterized protein LOC122380818 isoform X1 [Amphibalanus amphitrite]|nr:uncharacterized protein LOC122370762 [Amphibalanus amphitrite]XP_043202590.1 uncharacterized protein LOC122370762 [Amphibalanus amphitrite]XP_043202591.1 uncharacterized protein LOC122370762 [Amphibalanus amphitrite]XP_043202592.1 uncharacterized protein LOC122370762 [Amphibalanus amphitrite]XP_043202593.1 uncharacterized protein LOC122370762 [Amphibalanus amphitrite]XP_043202594.1 uncharacterized protein LOC122370762 [Amphibalanus amphitrite]XP_043202595.1 uncharacterized protein LOC12237